MIHLGTAAPQESTTDPIKEFTDMSTEFFGRRAMTKDETEETGRKFLEKALEDSATGVKEKHPTRSEVKLINEDGSFPKTIEEDIIPCYEQYQHCTFEAKEGYFEMANQIMRAKIRALRKSGGSLFGPKKVLTAKEIERRRVVAENARMIYEIIKATQLVLDALNWRIADKRLQAAEYELSGLELDDARVWFERDRMIKILAKCISKLSQAIQAYAPEKAQPVIGLLPSGRRRPITIHYGLEGEPIDELMPDPESQSDEPIYEPDEAESLFFLLRGARSYD
jgi:hypothetical protein